MFQAAFQSVHHVSAMDGWKAIYSASSDTRQRFQQVIHVSQLLTVGDLI